jgi:hypothetical protein
MVAHLSAVDVEVRHFVGDVDSRGGGSHVRAVVDPSAGRLAEPSAVGEHRLPDRRESNPAGTVARSQLRLQHPIFFTEERDHVVLLRRSQPHSAATNNWNGNTGESYVSSARSSFWDSTAFGTRFSALRYSITSCCSAAIQRTRAANSICCGNTRESLPDRCPVDDLDTTPFNLHAWTRTPIQPLRTRRERLVRPLHLRPAALHAA